MARILRLTSPAFSLRIQQAASPYSIELDEWVFQEHFEAPRRSFDSEAYGRYHVTMDHAIGVDEDAGNAFISGEYHAHALEKAWLYGTGTTIGGRGYDFLLPPGPPAPAVDQQCTRCTSRFGLGAATRRASYSPSQRVAPTLPLKACIAVLSALADADDVTAQLTTYHFGAVTTVDPDLHLLLFAQRLEIARVVLPGNTKHSKEAGLPAAVTSRLSHGLDCLFEMSNQRRQTRHAIDKKGVVALGEARRCAPA
jgi:hypothetical protein